MRGYVETPSTIRRGDPCGPRLRPKGVSNVVRSDRIVNLTRALAIGVAVPIAISAAPRPAHADEKPKFRGLLKK